MAERLGPNFPLIPLVFFLFELLQFFKAINQIKYSTVSETWPVDSCADLNLGFFSLLIIFSEFSF